MPEGKPYIYDIDTPHGKFTVTSDRELPDSDILSAAQKFVQDESDNSIMGRVRGDRAVRTAQAGGKVHPFALLGAGVGRGVTDLVSGTANLVRSLPGTVKDIASNVMEGHGAATVRGFGQGAREGAKSLTDISGQLGDTDKSEPALTRVGRVGANTALLLGAKPAVQGVRGAMASRAAARAATQAELRAAARQLAGDIPDEMVAAGMGGPAPVRPTLQTGTGVPRPAAISATGQPIGNVRPGMTGTATGGSVPPPSSPPIPPGFGQTGMGIPARPQILGGGGFSSPAVARPGPRPVPPAGSRIAPDQARPAAQPPKTNPVTTIGDALEEMGKKADDVPTAPPVDKPRFAPTTEQLTARASASKRAPVAGKELDDFIAGRYKDFTGEVPYDKLVKDLRDQFGSERAARMLGITREEVKKLAPGPSKTPARGRDAIAEAERKGRVGNERGAVNPKVLFPLAGAGAGAVGATLMDDEGGDAAIGRALLGGIGGAGLGAFAANPGGIARGLGRARVESMLTGAAIPKNLATAAGSAITSTLEGTGTSRFAPMREMFNPVKNAKEFAQAWKNPAPHQTGFVMSGQGAKSAFAPSRVIGAIDETAQRALRRAGVGQENIDRMLLTAENDLSALGANTPVGRWFLPFQRTPANAVREGFRELSGLHPGSGKTAMQRALTVGSVPAGAAIGEWTRGNPKQRGLLAAILLASLGSRTLPATIAASSVAGRQVVGGMSPVPEMAFDLRSGTGFPPAGVKLWQRLMDSK